MNARDPIPLETAERMLTYVRGADDRDTWVKLANILKDEYGEEARAAWIDWGQQSASFNERDARDVWKTAGGGSGSRATMGTVVHLAKEGGYKREASERRMSPEEIADSIARRDARQAEHARQEAIATASAAAEANDFWQHATPAESHPYLSRKNIAGSGARILDEMPATRIDPETGEIHTFTVRNVLLVPMRHGPGPLVGLQAINADGSKRFLRGTPVSGAYHVLGKPDRRGTVVIAEGFATAATIHQATGLCTVVAFNAGNLRPVAEKIRAAMPDARLVIAADDDAFTAGNPGLRAAISAARACAAGIAVPQWPDTRGEATDFNDLFALAGADAVVSCFASLFEPDDLSAMLATIADKPVSVGAPQAVITADQPNNTGSDDAGSQSSPAGEAGTKNPDQSLDTADSGVDVITSAEQAPYNRSMAVAMFGLDANDNGAPHATVSNIVRVLQGDRTLFRTIWYDEFLGRVMTIWRGDSVREWADIDDINLQIYLQTVLGMPKLGKQTVSDAVTAIAHGDTRNEALAYINGLTWDGVERLPTFLAECFGTEDTAYTRGAGTNFWISIVARVIRPGCKVDTMLVLEGIQGAGKSKALNTIGGQWFAEANQSPSDKDFYMNLSGKMLIEIGEMDAFSRSEVTKVKQVITCQTDRYRAPYEKRAADHPRRCVFAGTTNRDDWNKDETGARRFWPVICRAIDHEKLAALRDQYFAEAAHRLANGADWWTMPEDETKHEQEARRDVDELESDLSNWLIGKDEITVGEIMSDLLKSPLDRQDKALQMRVGKALKALKWYRPAMPVYVGGKTRRVWRRPGAVIDLPF